ncbi:hypothetical protein CSUB01_12514 [Colletotrichum sublineola]|uniref:Uncharacterized protein n=1 Tax=Colletotrichum sublineola TaxID=1173701 RepID=A0A066XIS9_COLSU|nr:hypothetical protein CSUB01_12514 [Colletotrichum sublineola]
MPLLTCDPRGDLTFRVDQKDILVCSRTVARSSTVFRAMLFTGFAESKPEGESTWTVDLPDDAFYPTLLLLTIIHGNFVSVPNMLKPEELYELLVVADKYDMIHTLKPMVSTWYQPHKDAITVVGNEIFLWIAWGLGDKKTFEHLALQLVLDSKVNKHGQLLDGNGNLFNKHRPLVPSGILERIAQTREDTIQKIGFLLRKTMRASLEGQGCLSPKYPRTKRKAIEGHRHMGGHECSAMTLGLLMRYIKALNFEHLNPTHMTTPLYLGSINSLVSSINYKAFACNVLHPRCDPLPAFRTRVSKVVQEVSSPVSNTEVEHLQKQGKKTGLDKKRPVETDESGKAPKRRL